VTTATSSAVPQKASGQIRSGQISLVTVIRSEFTKLRSVRSTYWTLIILALVTVGIGILLSAVTAAHWSKTSASTRASFDPVTTSLAGFFLGQLIIAVLGALAITSEYSTGMIRTSLATQPHRAKAYLGKAAAFAIVAFCVGLIASFAAFFAGQALLSSTHTSVTLGDHDVLRAVLGGGLFLAACGLLAFGLGAILRHTAGAITAAAGLLFVLPILANILPSSWQQDVANWLPSNAGSRVMTVRHIAHQFSPWVGFAIFCGYTAIVLGVGLVLFLRRDA
jgi:ABC-2 type transport system permease protein